MKALKLFNTIALMVPVVIAFAGIFDNMFLFYAIVSLIFTGIVQTIIAFVFWAKNTRNRLIPIYFLFSLLFFLYFFGYRKFDIGDALEVWFWIVPIFLALYLSMIIYTSKDDSA